jgi:hypothetical protein
MTLLRAFLRGLLALAALAGSTSPANAQLVNHGGPVIVSAKVVFIFWGPTFSDVASPDHTYATTLQAYRNQLGTTAVYNILAAYTGSNGTIQLANLGTGTADGFDTSTPPHIVTDANVQAKIQTYLQTHTFNPSTVYEVVLPSTSYSSFPLVNGSSCGGPNFSYCGYHNWIGSGTSATKYAVEPYPSCASCQTFGWTAAQNQEHFVLYDTAGAVTDPTGVTFYDGSGREIGDLCEWSPAPYIGTGSYAYQYLWSSAFKSCVKTR